MSSWIQCVCGQLIGTGSFPNDHVSSMVSELDYDGLDDPIDRAKIAGLFVRSRSVVECPLCGRLHLQRAGSDEWDVYIKEEAAGRSIDGNSP